MRSAGTWRSRPSAPCEAWVVALRAISRHGSTCKNVVLVRVINSMTDFKQIIGRGTRVRDDYGKLYFNILDYTGSATRLFADPDFDGEPALVAEETMDESGAQIESTVVEEETVEEREDVEPPQ